MKIIEARDGFIKFEADESIYLSAFVRVPDFEKDYIAQVIQIKKAAGISIAFAKILFLDIDNELKNYDNTLPSKETELFLYDFDNISKSIKIEKPVIIGKSLDKNAKITIDRSAFANKMLASIDSKNSNNLFVRNIVNQFNNLNQNVVILDFAGVLDAKKYIAGKDFKIPLDTASLAFMYEECLNDATAESKSTVVEIFQELAEYSKTVPFVPFGVLKSIVDDMVDNKHIFKLLVLKNKLAKFERLGYFATKEDEVKQTEKLLNSKCVIIDLSILEPLFRNRYLSFLYDKLSGMKNIQVILEAANAISKKNMKNIIFSESVNTLFVTHSNFTFLNDIKEYFDNYIIEPSVANNRNFNQYSAFLNSMGKNCYLIAGKMTNYMPIVSEFEEITETADYVSDIKEEKESVVDETELEDMILDSLQPENTPPEEDTPEEIPESQNAPYTDITDMSDNPIIASIDKKTEEVIESVTNDSEEDVVIENMFGSEDTDNTADITEQELSENFSDTTENLLSETDDISGQIDSTDENNQTEVTDTVAEQISNFAEDNDVADSLTENNLIDSNFIEDSLESTEIDSTDNSDSLTDNEISPTEADMGDDSLLQTTINLEPDMDLVLDNDIQESTDSNLLEEEPSIPEPEPMKVIPISDNPDELDQFQSYDDLTELEPGNLDEDDIIVDISDNDTSLKEDTDAEIMKDVDSVYTTLKDDDISDSDLDLIDELHEEENNFVLDEVGSNDDSLLEEISETDDNNGILEEYQPPVQDLEGNEEKNAEILETRNSSTPIVPVYDADIPQEDMVMSDPIQQGDSVTHVRYGSGVVEKMIKYGNKTLFAINFENIGRRLLDPTLTEIKKA